jgi:hypothetical protein
MKMGSPTTPMAKDKNRFFFNGQVFEPGVYRFSFVYPEGHVYYIYRNNDKEFREIL